MVGICDCEYNFSVVHDDMHKYENYTFNSEIGLIYAERTREE